jgi:hypothetical protein
VRPPSVIVYEHMQMHEAETNQGCAYQFMDVSAHRSLNTLVASNVAITTFAPAYAGGAGFAVVGMAQQAHWQFRLGTRSPPSGIQCLRQQKNLPLQALAGTASCPVVSSPCHGRTFLRQVEGGWAYGGRADEILMRLTVDVMEFL